MTLSVLCFLTVLRDVVRTKCRDAPTGTALTLSVAVL